VFFEIIDPPGCAVEFPVARLYRDTLSCFMVEGSADICKWIIRPGRLAGVSQGRPMKKNNRSSGRSA
jgi:hypothetical protein